MTTITDKLAEALREAWTFVKNVPTDSQLDARLSAGWSARERVKAWREALAAYDAQLAEARPVITDKQIQQLGERFGFGTPAGDDFIWFDGNPSDMIRAAVAELGA